MTLPRARKFACIFHPMHANFNNFALVQQRVRQPTSRIGILPAPRKIANRGFCVSKQALELLQFRSGTSLARPAPFPVRQLTVRRWAAGDYGYGNGITLFSSSVQGVFPAQCILVLAQLGALMALFLHFLIVSVLFGVLPIKRTSGTRLSTRTQPFPTYSALVGGRAGCGYLTPSLIVPFNEPYKCDFCVGHSHAFVSLF